MSSQCIQGMYEVGAEIKELHFTTKELHNKTYNLFQYAFVNCVLT